MSIVNAAKFLMRQLPTEKGINVFRGEPFKNYATMKQIAEEAYGLSSTGSQANNPLRLAAAGRWFTRNPEGASTYAGLGRIEPGRIKKITLSPYEEKVGKRLAKKIADAEGKQSYGLIIPKSAMSRVETDYIRTVALYLRRMLNML
tara:strand:+ start:32 stop:469 length:438 start_codon:yes stop_codon:yes gene_type:complete